MTKDTTGKIHSFQSLGTVDGPGVRFVVFMQGCPLRCACCHNPDTWALNGGNEFTPNQVLDKILRYKDYFGQDGGITVSGGEPLLQPLFLESLFKLCHEKGIHTCLDTSGCILNEDVKRVLEHTDLVLLDVKYSNEDLYKKYVGCELSKVLDFLSYLKQKNIKTTIRQVIIPTVNDDEASVKSLKNLLLPFTNVNKVELLGFRKICQSKYDQLGINFLFGNLPETDGQTIEKLNKLLNN